ncbi:HIRAN domain-containing protein [Microbacterium sp. BWT-B31]|uniref:HIRAN domain-containing protein n=1 Tax=Microbacterium sp. BWT-B31 TaxID=3232072 RepID=UPI00352826BE
MPTWWEQLLHLTTGRVDRHTGLPDLRPLPSRRVALERTHYLVNDRERLGQERRLYVLRREPTSRRNPTGIAVFSNGRTVGYLPDRIATDLAPLLDSLGGAAVVNGAGTLLGSMRLRVDVPTDEALREFVGARVEG